MPWFHYTKPLPGALKTHWIQISIWKKPFTLRAVDNKCTSCILIPPSLSVKPGIFLLNKAVNKMLKGHTPTEPTGQSTHCDWALWLSIVSEKHCKTLSLFRESLPNQTPAIYLLKYWLWQTFLFIVFLYMQFSTKVNKFNWYLLW